MYSFKFVPHPILSANQRKIITLTDYFQKFGGMTPLKFNDLKNIAVLFKGDAVAKIASRYHTMNPPMRTRLPRLQNIPHDSARSGHTDSFFFSCSIVHNPFAFCKGFAGFSWILPKCEAAETLTPGRPARRAKSGPGTFTVRSAPWGFCQ